MNTPQPDAAASTQSTASRHGDAAPVYTYLGPEGTFTETALLQVPGADAAHRIPSPSVDTALERVRTGAAAAAMVPIENSVEGGVSATLDAIAAGTQLQIVREVVVPISFVLVARDGVTLGDVRVVSTHAHAWAQCREWMNVNIPSVEYVPSSSTAAAALGLLAAGSIGPRTGALPAAGNYDAAICSHIVAERHRLNVLAHGVEDNAGAVTRFVLVSGPGPLPEPTGSDKTTLVIPLPEDHPGALMEILDQFAARGVNLSRIESRPTGQFLGDYFFSIDAEGHARDARMVDALTGLHRISPSIRFLGSYPRADGRAPSVPGHHRDEAFRAASSWVDSVLRGE